MSGAMTPPAPDPGAMPPPDMGDAGGDTVVCTISKTADGGYMVFAGDEPDEGEAGDMSGDDVDAMGSGGMGAGGAGGGGAGAGGDVGAAGAGGSPGQPADSIGAALKAALDILQSDVSSGGSPGSADQQFSAGFGASKSPTPVGMGGA